MIENLIFFTNFLKIVPFRWFVSFVLAFAVFLVIYGAAYFINRFGLAYLTKTDERTAIRLGIFSALMTFGLTLMTLNAFVHWWTTPLGTPLIDANNPVGVPWIATPTPINQLWDAEHPAPWTIATNRPPDEQSPMSPPMDSSGG